MKVKTASTTQSQNCTYYKAKLWDVGSAKPTRAYIRFPIVYCLLEFWKVFK